MAEEVDPTLEEVAREPALVPGRWYLWTAPGGFTLIGQYVRELGMDRHRFRHCVHFLNAGGRYLPQICAQGPARETKLTPMFPRPWQGTPIWWTEYLGPKPWLKT
jgi:hypothetical protein